MEITSITYSVKSMGGLVFMRTYGVHGMGELRRIIWEQKMEQNRPQ